MSVTYGLLDSSAVITLNRPDKLNAIDAAMVTALHQALDRAEADPQVVSILLRGAGNSFCAGFDLGEMEISPTRAETRRMLEADFDIILRFWHCAKPTLSVVQGYALGGGFELAMACDMTLCLPDALFGEPEPKFGSGIVALLLPWLTGPKQAKEMLLFGNDRIPAERALQMGLVNRVVAPERIEAEIAMLTRACAGLDQTAVRLTKQAINQSYDEMGFRRAMRMALEIDLDIETTDTEESLAFKTILKRDGVKAAIAWREKQR